MTPKKAAAKKTAVKMQIATRGSADCCKPPFHGKCGGYGLGFIGAVIYYIQHAVGFWAAVLGILKALVWPAFVVYKLLEFLKG